MTESRMQQYETLLRENDEHLQASLSNITGDSNVAKLILSMKNTVLTLLKEWQARNMDIMNAFNDINKIRLPYTKVDTALVRGVSSDDMKAYKAKWARENRKKKKLQSND